VVLTVGKVMLIGLLSLGLLSVRNERTVSAEGSAVTCSDAVSHWMTLIAGGRPQDALKPFFNLAKTRCEQDGWSPDARLCLMNAATADASGACNALLTKVQADALGADVAKISNGPKPVVGQTPLSAISAVPLAHAGFADFCSKWRICPRFKTSYTEIRPDRCISSGISMREQRGDETDCPVAQGDVHGTQVESTVLMFTSPPTVPAELVDGVREYLIAQQMCSQRQTSAECLRFAWVTTDVIRADEDDGAPDNDNRIVAIGVRSILGNAVHELAPGSTLGLVGTTFDVSDLETDFLLDRFKDQVLAKLGGVLTPKVQRDPGFVSIVADSPAETVAVSARVYIQRGSTKKTMKTEWDAMDKAALTAQLQLISNEAREAWRRYWMQKLQAKSMDEVAQYLILQSGKQMERGEFAAARTSVAAMHFFAPDLSPKVQNALGEAINKADQVLAEDLKKKREKLDAERKAAEERQRAYEAFLKKQSSPKERVRRELCYVTVLLPQKQAALAFEDEVEKESGVTDLKRRHDLGGEIVGLNHSLQGSSVLFQKLYKRAFAEPTDCVDLK
jgi:hypothetical protein